MWKLGKKHWFINEIFTSFILTVSNSLRGSKLFEYLKLPVRLEAGRRLDPTKLAKNKVNQLTPHLWEAFLYHTLPAGPVFALPELPVRTRFILSIITGVQELFFS